MIKYINKETKEVYNNPGEVRKALSPKKLPKTLTKAVLDNNNLDYLYEGVKPALNQFQRHEKSTIEFIDGKFQETYIVVEAFTEDQKAEVLEKIVEQAKKEQVQVLKDSLDKKLDDILIDSALTEKMSWDKQESEARAYATSNDAITPYIDALLIARDNGETKESLVQSILTKADAYCQLHASILGDYHKKLKLVKDFSVAIEKSDEDLRSLKSVLLESI